MRKLIFVLTMLSVLAFSIGVGAQTLTTKGDVLTHNGSSEVRLGVGETGQMLTPDGSGNPFWTNPPEGDDLFNANVLLNAYRTAENGSRPVLKMVDATVDAFEDSSGIDAAGSTNESYSAAKLYKPVSSGTASSASGEWSGATGSLTFSGDDIESTTNDKAIQTQDTFAGDFTFQWTFQASPSNGGFFVGFYSTADEGSFDKDKGNGGVLNTTGVSSQFSFFGLTNLTYNLIAGGSTEQSGIAMVAGDVLKWERIGTTIKFYKNSGLVRTMTATSSATVRLMWQKLVTLQVDSISTMLVGQVTPS